MFFKRQLIIKNYMKMFLGCSLHYIIIKYYWGRGGGGVRGQYCFTFQTINDFMRFFFESGLKLIFYWKAHLFTFTKSLFSSRVEALLSWIIENKVPPANSLAFEDNFCDKSLIYIMNSNGQSIKPWETPALTPDQSRNCPFNKAVFSFFSLHFSESHIKD